MFLKYKNYNLVAAGFSLRKLFGSRKPWFAHIICSCRPWSAKIKAKQALQLQFLPIL